MSEPEMSQEFLEGDDYRPDYPENGLRNFVFDPARLKQPRRVSAPKPRPLTTRGHLPEQRERAWVYIALGRDGALKIGMTTNLQQRANTLRVVMLHVVPVVPEAAKEVETEALRLLGKAIGEDEWVEGNLSAAKSALEAAMADVRRRRHVDVDLTPSQAKKQRIALANTQARA
jgi:hypothetical protein